MYLELTSVANGEDQRPEPAKQRNRKPLTEAQRRKRRADAKLYRERHREERKAKAKAYYQANKEAFQRRKRKNKYDKPWKMRESTERYFENVGKRLQQKVSKVDVRRIRRELLEGDLCSKIRRLIPTWIPASDRQDIANDVIVGILEKRIAPADLKRFVRLYSELHAHRSNLNIHTRSVSLDELVFEDGERTRLDEITYEDALWS